MSLDVDLGLMENLPLKISPFLSHPDTTLVPLPPNAFIMPLVTLKQQSTAAVPWLSKILYAAQFDGLFSRQCHPSCLTPSDVPSSRI